MSVLCKMVCHDVSPLQNCEGMYRVTFGAVYSQVPDSENADFGKVTPFGNFQANFTEKAATQYEVGKEYFFHIGTREEIHVAPSLEE